jgi:hypothetical protein
VVMTGLETAERHRRHTVRATVKMNGLLVLFIPTRTLNGTSPALFQRSPAIYLS